MKYLVLAATALLPACAADRPRIAAAACDPVPAQPFVGEPAARAERAQRAARASTLRVVEPGQMVTMDYQPGRLTVETDANGRIVRAVCG